MSTRPLSPTPHTKRYVLTLGDDRHHRVAIVSSRLGLSMSDFVRLAVDGLLQRVLSPSSPGGPIALTIAGPPLTLDDISQPPGDISHNG